MSIGTVIFAVLVLTHLLGAVTAVVAIMRTRTPQGAIAWAGGLIVFPYFALPAYWVFGRSRFRGYVEAIQAQAKAVDPLITELTHRLEPYLSPRAERTPAEAALEVLAGTGFTQRNDVALLVDGTATFDDIFAGIKRAERYVFIEFFIVHHDRLGRRFAEALVEKAREGVRVCLLYDRIGSAGLSRGYVEGLRHAGVEVHAFATAKGPGNRFQINFRNHRKIVVVDGEVAWVGGHNVGDEYLGEDPTFGRWRDTHIRVEGPEALGAQLAFSADWCWVTGEVLEQNLTPLPSDAADRRALSLWTGPADEVDTAELFFTHVIHSAKRRLWIATPYFVPTPPVVAALELAALRGLEVRVLLPKHNNHKMAGLASFATMADLDGLGIEFSLYPDGFMHQKVMLVDDHLAVVGTHNFDFRSFRLNFEIGLVVDDRDFASKVEDMLVTDFAAAEHFDPRSISKRPFWFRFAMRVAQLMAPAL